jgi:hypothetical protein
MWYQHYCKQSTELKERTALIIAKVLLIYIYKRMITIYIKIIKHIHWVKIDIIVMNY